MYSSEIHDYLTVAIRILVSVLKWTFIAILGVLALVALFALYYIGPSMWIRSIQVYSVALRVYFSYYIIRKSEKYLKRRETVLDTEESAGTKVKSYLVRAFSNLLIPESVFTDWWNSTHSTNAELLYHQAVKLKGLYVKMGQYISSRSDVFPDAYITSLQRCQDACLPHSFEDTCRIICDEYHVNSIYDVFDEFETTPIASASIAQVYKADFRGYRVAVKVQHPNVDQIILRDLKVAKQIVDLVAWAMPEYDLRPIMNEWCNEVPHELDFIRERASMRRVEAAMHQCRFNTSRDSPLFIECEFPQILEQLAYSRRVLVMSFIDGVKITDVQSLEDKHVDMERLLTNITRAFGSQVFLDGCFSGDPHPANLMVRFIDPSEKLGRQPSQRRQSSSSMMGRKNSNGNSNSSGGSGSGSAGSSANHEQNAASSSASTLKSVPSVRFTGQEQKSTGSAISSHNNSAAEPYHPCVPVLLDFGLTKVLSTHTKLSFAKMILSANQNDVGSLIDSFDEMGLILSSSYSDLYAESIKMTKFFFRDSKPKEEARQELRSEMRRRRKRMKKLKQEVEIRMQSDTSLRRNPIEAFPGDLIFFSRMLFLIRGLATRLGVRQSYLTILSPFARKALEDHARSVAAAQPAIPAFMPLVPRLQKRIIYALQKLAQTGIVTGVQVCMFKDGKCIVNLPFGTASTLALTKVERNTLFNVFSVSKAFTATLIHSLIDHGMMELEDEISRYWPGFETQGKEGIQVRHALSHTSGLSRAGIDHLAKNPFDIMDWKKMCDVVRDAVPTHKPGEKCEYHALSFGFLLGYIAEQAGRASFKDLMRTEIVDLLGLEREFFINPDANEFKAMEPRLACLTTNADFENIRERFSRMSKEKQENLRARLKEYMGQRPMSLNPVNPGMVSQHDIAAASAPLVEELKRDTQEDDDDDEQSSEEENEGQAGSEITTTTTTTTTTAEDKGDDATAASSNLTALPTFFNSKKIRQACIPAANGHATAYAVATLFEMLSNDGISSITGQRVLHRGTVARIAKKLGHEQIVQWDAQHASSGGNTSHEPGSLEVDHDHFPFGLGLKTVGDDANIALSHAGMGGSLGFCDVNSRFSLGVTVNHLNPKPIVALAMLKLACMEFRDLKWPKELDMTGIDFY
eukprot:CAMPEP_0184693252 /NCGR_PEP_ID=MMETSP0313-20130426/1519_1 /TAXON_ID=2792 /ORGANISM="Porphyridium aerugineum, Strain SAG 1380-2" /LENGTH=1141 /DNA_ID=CAMNT_0027151283 /DNA_START=117 /DNA_END=3542 /DNA_ORIENTATION=-